MNRRDFLYSVAAALVGCRDRPEPRVEGSLEATPAAMERPASRVSAAPRRPVLGINSHLLLDEDLQLIRELGFTHVRSTLVTQLWTDHPTYSTSARENTARTAAYGLGLMYVVHNAYGEVFRLGDDPDAARRFTATVEDMARRLPEVESWQLWNEQDVWVQAPFGAGTVPPRSPERVGENYARWWADAYPRVKSVRPEANVVTGATADHAAGRWRGFLRGMAEVGVSADAVAVNRYGEWDSVRAAILAAREMTGATTPIWLTECGAAGGPGWTPAKQLESWRSTIEGNEREQLAERIYPYALQTDPNDPWYGVRNVDGTARPVLEWLRARAASERRLRGASREGVGGSQRPVPVRFEG